MVISLFINFVWHCMFLAYCSHFIVKVTKNTRNKALIFRIFIYFNLQSHIGAFQLALYDDFIFFVNIASINLRTWTAFRLWSLGKFGWDFGFSGVIGAKSVAPSAMLGWRVAVGAECLARPLHRDGRRDTRRMRCRVFGMFSADRGMCHALAGRYQTCVCGG